MGPSDFSGAITGLICAVAIVAAMLTAAAIFGLPWLWRLVAPWLHAISA